mmetsp:Transcript_78349/g.208017  ORF Transcript_78349/g.208017 Transcript_78349/m.208017 type:complete len:98 (-) Transcript_78349:260-553(-)
MAAESNPQESPKSQGSRTSGLPHSLSKHSIISGKSGRNSRIDCHGNVIEKGKKMHRCSFRDERDPSQSVEEKIEVASYKGVIFKDMDSQPGCSCSLM